MGSNTQINLDYDQLVHCVKYNILFFCEQMFLEKQGNEHTCESAIYTNQNEKLIQQKCTIEYYSKLDPDLDILDAGNYILLGDFSLPWTYFCEQKDEIPTPISGSSYVIIKKHDLCQCSLSAGSWYLEANIAYCTEDPDNPSTQLTLYYTVNMATVIYQFQEKLKTEGITDLTLFTEQIPFDAKEPDLIVEEDTYVLQDTSPAVNYKEVMEDFAMRCYLSKPDLAMYMAEPSHWFGGHNSWLTFVGVAAVLVVVLIPFLLFTLYKYCGFRFQFQKVNSILAKLLILNKTAESIPPTLAQPMTEFGEMTLEMFDLKVLQLVLIVMAFTLTCYLLIRITLWLFDYFITFITSMSTPKNPGPMLPPRSTTSTGRRTSNANPTASTPASVLTDAVQKCVDTAAEAIATHREAKLVFMQGLVKRILREAYREPITPPSVGTSLAQSVFAGVPPPSRGPPPYFVTQPNYHNGQFHQYYPPENPIPNIPISSYFSSYNPYYRNEYYSNISDINYILDFNNFSNTIFNSSLAVLMQQYLEKHTELILILLLLIWWNLSPKLTIF